MTSPNISHAGSTAGTHSKPQSVRRPSDWIAGRRASLVRHGPTNTVFEIFARPDLAPDDILTWEDFSARIVDGGRGGVIPAHAGLEVLRGEATLMALFFIGLAYAVKVNPEAADREGITADGF